MKVVVALLLPEAGRKSQPDGNGNRFGAVKRRSPFRRNLIKAIARILPAEAAADVRIYLVPRRKIWQESKDAPVQKLY